MRSPGAPRVLEASARKTMTTIEADLEIEDFEVLGLSVSCPQEVADDVDGFECLPKLNIVKPLNEKHTRAGSAGSS